MKIINKLVTKIASKRLSEIDYFRKNPHEVQFNVFKELIDAGKNTEYGKKYNFDKINSSQSIADFQKYVPPVKYEDLEFYINKIREGEKNILWNSEIKWFAKSSGTTGSKSKFIPVSSEAMDECHFQGGKDVISVYTSLFPETQFYKGKGLAIGGSQKISNLSKKQYSGDLSALLIENMPFWLKMMRAPEKNIALMAEWESKIEKMAQSTINKKITSISGVPSWTLILIKRILEITGKSNLLDVWQDLELFVHGGVSFTPYREEYKKIIPSSDMHYLETYNASEGFFALQDDLSTNDMLLMLDLGIFYEFIPMKDFEKENPQAIILQDVELDKNYAMLITTNAGLWRYLIGDTVKFTSKNPYKIQITGRTKHFINAFGEELIIDNAEKAINKACKKTGAKISDYTAAPIYMQKKNTGGHEWIIEFSEMPNNIEQFIDVLDKTLQEVNSDYEAKRYKDMALQRPKINIGKKGIFHEWLKQNNKLGGQHKIPRLSNNRILLEELLKIQNG